MADAVHMRVGRFDVIVTRKRMKNLYLRVSAQDGAVSVSAPLHTSEAQIAQFVRSREEWIARQIEKARYARADAL